ncbi:MAG: CcmD family protein [Humidesulfovibrio sp.]|nr:CcmD family protein [Humidesulfovibrio sp.]MDQ7834689.1 CcmD family protein [Humidesulfovibrio sp.]
MNGYLVAANVAVWFLLAAYGAWLVLRGRAVDRRLKQLEMLK